MKKVWFKNYPAGALTHLDTSKYDSILDMFEESVQKYPDRAAYINMGQVLTFRKLEELSRAFATYLKNELKLSRGDRVALMMPNLLQYPIALFGVLRAGLVVVNVNPLYTAHELEHQLQDSGAVTIVIVSNVALTLEKIIRNTSVEHIIITNIGDQLSWGKRTLTNFVVKYVKKLVQKCSLTNTITFREVLRVGKSYQYIQPQIGRRDLAFLQYTGGTTGISKGAMLTHGNIITNIFQAKWVVSLFISDHHKQRIAVLALPLYHIFALTVNCLLFIELGVTSVLITNPRDIEGFIKEIKRYPFEVITGVNTLFNALLNHENFKEVDFSRLKLSVGGGSAIQQAVAIRWRDTTGCNLIEGYGMTECSPLISVCLANVGEYSGSVGIPVPNTDIKIIKGDGREAKIGESGELWVKGAQVMKGYWQRPEATSEVLKDGWIATGDIVIMDDTYNLRIVDRKKEMILVSGFNVYPNEIEDAIMLNDKVLEVVAIGVPNAVSGEVVKVFIVKKEESLTKEELQYHCRQYLTGYKVPKEIEFRETLPKTNVGKILRRILRDEELANNAQIKPK